MQIFGYLLFGFSLFYAFFLWQFPYDQVRRVIIQGFEEAFPMKLSIGRVGPSFPSNVAVENISIDSGSVLLQVPDMSLHPNLLGFFWGKTGFSLEGPGKSPGLLGEFQSQKNQNRVKIRLNNMVIKASAGKETSLQMKLSGEVSFDWRGEDFEKGTGLGWALLERGEIRGTQNSQLPAALALFDRIRAEVQLKEGMLRVKRLEVSGKDFNGSFQGDFPFPGKGKGDFPDLGLFLQPSGKTGSR
jgi:type II secretion system protein N